MTTIRIDHPSLDELDRAVAGAVLDLAWARAEAPELRAQAGTLLAVAHAFWRAGHAALPLDPCELSAAGYSTVAAFVADSATATALAHLAERALVGSGAAPAAPEPFVIERDEGGRPRRLYPARTFRAEREIAEHLRAAVVAEAAAGGDFSTNATALLGAAPSADQARALAAALSRRVCVISGGPGTGKTWLSARILAALAAARQSRGGAPLVVLAVAPTGKAAARFQESLSSALTGPAGEQLAAALGDNAAAIMQQLAGIAAQTIHRAVGWGRSRPTERLHADVVVVDEGSMVDLEVMAALLGALPPDTSLIVLGDTAQLASVGAGSVFADLVAAGGDGASLAGHVVTLHNSRRFPADSDIGAVAAAVTSPAADVAGPAAVIDRLRAAAADTRWVEVDLARASAEDLFEQLAAPYLALAARVADARAACEGGSATAAGLLAAVIAAVRILTPFREGPLGVADLNRGVAQRVGKSWSPLLVTRNHYGIGLMNGDLGIRFGDRAWFVDGEGVRGVSAASLPPHEPAWAMTIHKSQGSEYDRVAVVVPPREGPGREIVTRELLFTALTRVRLSDGNAGRSGPSLELFAAEADLRDALARRAVRFGGLRERLGA